MKYSQYAALQTAVSKRAKVLSNLGDEEQREVFDLDVLGEQDLAHQASIKARAYYKERNDLLDGFKEVSKAFKDEDWNESWEERI
jgi:hypothetical protein